MRAVTDLSLIFNAQSPQRSYQGEIHFVKLQEQNLAYSHRVTLVKDSEKKVKLYQNLYPGKPLAVLTGKAKLIRFTGSRRSMQSYILTLSRLKSGNLWALSKADLNFCVRSTPLRVVAR